jgi:SEC-C motif
MPAHPGAAGPVHGLSAGASGPVLTVPGAPLAFHVMVYRFLRDELGATFIQYIPIIERATEATLPATDAGWGHGVKGRPLYTQEGSLVTHRSVGPEQYGGFLIEVFEDWARRGRYDPCTCGSGRKWKRCHGTPATATAV